jgi:hypothetical protein
MRVMKFGALAVSCGLVLGLLTLAGCSGTPTSSTPKAGNGTGDDKAGGGKKTPISAGNATIVGTVTFDGELPDMKLPPSAKEKFVKSPDDEKHCLNAKASDYEKGNPAWAINKDNKVEYVAVFLRPEGDTYFAVSPDDKAYKVQKDMKAELTQPFCSFKPNTIAVFSKYKDKDEKSKWTGQNLILKNDTNTAVPGDKGIPHNTKITKPDGGEETNQSLAPGVTFELKELAPNYKPYSISCSIHPWMSGSLLVFDHPYFAVTDENGKFKIEGAPVGHKVRLIAWHNAKGIINGDGKGEVTDLKDGENKHDFTIKK